MSLTKLILSIILMHLNYHKKRETLLCYLKNIRFNLNPRPNKQFNPMQSQRATSIHSISKWYTSNFAHNEHKNKQPHTFFFSECGDTAKGLWTPSLFVCTKQSECRACRESHSARVLSEATHRPPLCPSPISHRNWYSIKFIKQNMHKHKL